MPVPKTAVPHGYLALVLHAHLPFVRHPECDYFMEENWLFEAMTETYLPLLAVFENLRDDAIPFSCTMSLTPTLCAMLTDPLLQERYHKTIERMIELAAREVHRTRNDTSFNDTARMYLDKFRLCRDLFLNTYDGNLLNGFRRLQEEGFLEIITCGATHGYLPLMQSNTSAVRAQIKVAVQSHHSFFGCAPRGIWLPECGYYPGIEHILEQEGIRFFFLDSHGILCARQRPRYGVYAPLVCRGTKVAAFGRDAESSKAVWSAREGYPGDASYREFYRDIGFDLDMEYIKPYIGPIGIRLSTGIKYYRITGKGDHKLPYDRQAALATAAQHAGNFMFNRERQVEYLCSIMDQPPIIVAPYDAELFGHWWYEGPAWLNFLFRKLHHEQNTVTPITPSQYLLRHRTHQLSTPSLSSWGNKGYSEVWLDSSNDWIYRHLHIMEKAMTACARTHTTARGLKRRALNQMARELLLAQSSDWAFIMKTGTMVQYAQRRTREHIANFNRLHDDLQRNDLDEHFIALLEAHNNIFPFINYKVYA